MARTAWQFDSYAFPVNPDEDEGWVYEHLEPENVAINATRSSIQWGGTKSARRQTSGWFYGPNALEQYNKFRYWHNNRIKSTLIDHLGFSHTARLVKFSAKLTISNTEWAVGRSTWRYIAEWREE